jgi:Cu(I)/Ag(I) efflux system periplasmic protein CusF
MTMNNTHRLITAALWALAALPLSAQAQTPAVAAPTATASALPLSEGEVRKVHKDTQKITLRHGEIKNLDMPGMTMVFRVKDPALLDQVKPGDKVQFVAEKLDGALYVTRIQPKP